MSHEERLVRTTLRADVNERTSEAAARVMTELREARLEIERLRGAIGRLHAETIR